MKTQASYQDATLTSVTLGNNKVDVNKRKVITSQYRKWKHASLVTYNKTK